MFEYYARVTIISMILVSFYIETVVRKALTKVIKGTSVITKQNMKGQN